MSTTLRIQLREMADRWTVRSRMVRERLRDLTSAETIDRLVTEANELLSDDSNHHLTVEEAAKRANRCASSIRKYIASGRLPNVGRPYAPRVRLGDLRTIYPDV
jgi:hypothetical protein